MCYVLYKPVCLGERLVKVEKGKDQPVAARGLVGWYVFLNSKVDYSEGVGVGASGKKLDLSTAKHRSIFSV
jgi:hypothetical protein